MNLERIKPRLEQLFRENDVEIVTETYTYRKADDPEGVFPRNGKKGWGPKELSEYVCEMLELLEMNQPKEIGK